MSKRRAREQHDARLEEVRAHMRADGLDALLVRSADRFLNEYVPPEDSTRVWLTGFTGSMGEALVTRDAAYLAVDGRYWLQAERELSDAWTVLKVRMGTGIDQALTDQLGAIAASGRRGLAVGFDPHRLAPRSLKQLEAAVPRARFVPVSPSPVEKAWGTRASSADPGIRAVEAGRVGAKVADKLALVRTKVLEPAGAHGLLVQRLDEIMWLTNLRGTELPFQATFRCVALVTKRRIEIGLADPGAVPKAVREARPELRFGPEEALWSRVGRRGATRIALDPEHATVATQLALEARGATEVPVSAPLAPLRARKTPEELASMRRAFRTADRVVEATIAWANRKVAGGDKVTEASFAAEVERRFLEAGAIGLSFQVISAAGKNGAHIHYGPPSSRRALVPGELMLLDTGAYFEEGYATDLTRTFLVGGGKQRATAEQRRRYTLVLKAAIAGMKAVLPEGSRGSQLDALVRAPLWAEGLDYNHGTGHGVGINVHEFPPRVGPASQTVLEPGHVFSIEPGLYDPGFGGIRIENLCTVEPGPPGFIRVVPLTFSPLDARLIDRKMLNPDEKAFLEAFARSGQSADDARPRRGRAPANKRAGRARAARRPAR